MTDIKEFRSEISLATSSTILPLIDKSIIRTSIKFCEDTHIWRQSIPTINLVPNISEYDIDAPVESKLVMVEEVYINDVRIGPITSSDKSAYHRNVKGNKPYSYEMKSRNVLSVYPNSNESLSGNLDVIAVLKPEPTVSVLPDLLFDDWYDAIIEGAKARLYAMKKMDFFDPIMSRDCRNQYRKEMVKARNEVRKRHSNQSQKARIRPAA